MTESFSANELESVLGQVRRQAAELLAELSSTPRSLRVRAGDVAVDIEWPETAVDNANEPAGRVSASADRAGTPTATSDAQSITAETVGVFYRAREPGADPFVSKGDEVQLGQQVAIIEAMKIMIPVKTDVSGVIAEVLKGDGEPVEYGEQLFLVERRQHVQQGTDSQPG